MSFTLLKWIVCRTSRNVHQDADVVQERKFFIRKKNVAVVQSWLIVNSDVPFSAPFN